jgi:DNA invertase Pin-like site-specific DNA recombinase
MGGKMIIGYARVSTQEQSLDAQIEELKAAGAESIFAEKASDAWRERGFALAGWWVNSLSDQA